MEKKTLDESEMPAVEILKEAPAENVLQVENAQKKKKKEKECAPRRRMLRPPRLAS